MSERMVLIAVFVVEILFLGGLLFVLPQIGRRGLSFGVYVGEQHADDTGIRRIRHLWYRDMLVVVAVSAGLLFAAATRWDRPELLPFLTLPLLIGFVIAYLRAHRASRAFAVEPSGGAVAVLYSEPVSPWLPLLTTAICGAVGVGVLVYAIAHYPQLPERVPVHFDGAGIPDDWADRSFVGMMILPVTTLVMGVMVGLVAWLLLHAKRSVRQTDDPQTLHAPRRFQVAVSRFLCIEALLVTALLGWMAQRQIDVALGRAAGLGWAPALLGVAIGLVSMIGVIYLLARYGQGGALLESASNDALSDGLADNRHWKWGVFYVNAEDPSYFVEKRFGLGYTINFGNRWAVAGLAGFFVFMFGIIIAAFATA